MVEALAKKSHRSRSGVIVDALRDYLRRVESEALTRAYDEVYSEEPLSDEDRAWLEFALAEQERRLAEEGDRWPEK
jgi:predicted transcriptional regulator